MVQVPISTSNDPFIAPGLRRRLRRRRGRSPSRRRARRTSRRRRAGRGREAGSTTPAWRFTGQARIIRRAQSSAASALITTMSSRLLYRSTARSPSLRARATVSRHAGRHDPRLVAQRRQLAVAARGRQVTDHRAVRRAGHRPARLRLHSSRKMITASIPAVAQRLDHLVQKYVFEYSVTCSQYHRSAASPGGRTTTAEEAANHTPPGRSARRGRSHQQRRSADDLRPHSRPQLGPRREPDPAADPLQQLHAGSAFRFARSDR